MELFIQQLWQETPTLSISSRGCDGTRLEPVRIPHGALTWYRLAGCPGASAFYSFSKSANAETESAAKRIPLPRLRSGFAARHPRDYAPAAQLKLGLFYAVRIPGENREKKRLCGGSAAASDNPDAQYRLALLSLSAGASRRTPQGDPAGLSLPPLPGQSDALLFLASRAARRRCGAGIVSPQLSFTDPSGSGADRR